MKVAAPKGYHWMKQPNGSYKLMKHSGKFVKHKGASLKAVFKIQKRHTKKIMATTYLDLTNEILRELNEVPLTSTNFCKCCRFSTVC